MTLTTSVTKQHGQIRVMQVKVSELLCIPFALYRYIIYLNEHTVKIPMMVF